MTRMLLAALVLLVAAPLSARAQGKGPQDIPPAHRPPPGMCRIWISGVPAARQPAPTDCATAIRNRPSNARVIFGDDYRKEERAPSGPSQAQRERPRDDGDRKVAPPASEPRKPIERKRRTFVPPLFHTELGDR